MPDNQFTKEEKEYIQSMINKSIRQFVIGYLIGAIIIVVIYGIAMLLTR